MLALPAGPAYLADFAMPTPTPTASSFDAPGSDRVRLRAVRVWLWACAAMIFAMVVIGGITRLTESGLSITEWRPVTGILPPLDAVAWQTEFAKYQRIPEFREKNAAMTLAEFKTIFWWEYVHRLWGRLIGVVFAVPMAWFLVSGRVRGPLAWRLGGLLALGGLQGAVGWWMVASGLVDRVDVSPYRLATHLGLALVIFALVVWLALDLVGDTRAIRSRRVDWLGRSTLAALAVTMLAGAFVAGTDAGRIYNSFPLMDGRFVPRGYGDLSPWWLNVFENVAAIQFNHRWIAVATALLILGYVGAVHASRANPRATRRASWLGAAVLGQVVLGVLTLLYAVPVSLGALHQAGAVIVLTLALATHHATGRSAHKDR